MDRFFIIIISFFLCIKNNDQNGFKPIIYYTARLNESINYYNITSVSTKYILYFKKRTTTSNNIVKMLFITFIRTYFIHYFGNIARAIIIAISIIIEKFAKSTEKEKKIREIRKYVVIIILFPIL